MNVRRLWHAFFWSKTTTCCIISCADVIRHAGHVTDCARTKTEACRLLAQYAYDLVIADIALPDGSGHDIAATAESAGIKTIMMTGHPDEITALAATQRPHLAKPFDLDELAELVDRQLRGHARL